MTTLLAKEQGLTAPSPKRRGNRSSVFEMVVIHFEVGAIEFAEMSSLLAKE